MNIIKMCLSRKDINIADMYEYDQDVFIYLNKILILCVVVA